MGIPGKTRKLEEAQKKVSSSSGTKTQLGSGCCVRLQLGQNALALLVCITYKSRENGVAVG